MTAYLNAEETLAERTEILEKGGVGTAVLNNLQETIPYLLKKQVSTHFIKPLPNSNTMLNMLKKKN